MNLPSPDQKQRAAENVRLSVVQLNGALFEATRPGKPRPQVRVLGNDPWIKLDRIGEDVQSKAELLSRRLREAKEVGLIPGISSEAALDPEGGISVVLTDLAGGD